MTGPPTRTQVNIRLETHEAEVLAAVAFLTEASAAEVLRPLVRAFLQQQEQDPDVKAALEIRERRRATSG
jgi:hypothetical protein